MSSGHIITQRRKCMELTQEKLAEQINVSRQTIAMWETSKQFPSDNVAIIAARFLDIPEEELFEQLRWDRLHQRVNQLEKQYDATITVKPAKEGQRMEGLLENATQTIDGVTVTVTRIYKSIYWADPTHELLKHLLETMGGNLSGTAMQVSGPQDIEVYHTGERLILHLLVENRDQNLSPSKLYVEDDLGNHFQTIVCGSTKDRLVAVFDYAPEATSFTLRYNFVNGHEDECDVLSFEDVPIDGEGITRTFDDDIITYNGVHSDERKCDGDLCQIRLAFNKAREVRHVGVAAITDNLGNRYSPSGCSSGHDDSKGVFYSKLGVKPPIDSDARSISFRYLFAREIITFELRDLPLPS